MKRPHLAEDRRLSMLEILMMPKMALSALALTGSREGGRKLAAVFPHWQPVGEPEVVEAVMPAVTMIGLAMTGSRSAADFRTGSLSVPEVVKGCHTAFILIAARNPALSLSSLEGGLVDLI